MRVFTVHARNGDVPRTRLVREGFSLWAFLFGPFWLIARGLWLALIGYLVLTALVMGMIGSLPPDQTEALAGWGVLAIQLLLGYHARDLERWTLRRRGFAAQGVVVGHSRDDALLRLLTAKPALARGVLR